MAENKTTCRSKRIGQLWEREVSLEVTNNCCWTGIGQDHSQSQGFVSEKPTGEFGHLSTKGIKKKYAERLKMAVTLLGVANEVHFTSHFIHIYSAFLLTIANNG